MLKRMRGCFFCSTIRRLLSSARPDFIIAGAQKAGTTALYEYLSLHSNIQATQQKEYHFFDCDKQYQQGYKYYQSLFQFSTNSKLTLDASAGYLESTKAPSRIHAYNPDVKIIILLRDPVKRAYSAWNMYQKYYSLNRDWYDEWDSFCGTTDLTVYRRQDEHLFDFLQYVIDEMKFLANNDPTKILEAAILNHGNYYEQIQRYLSFFNKSQILILENEEMKLNTVNALRNVESFLGIPNYDWTSQDISPVFEGKYSEPIDETAKRLLCDYYSSSNEQLFKLLGKRYNWGGEC